TREEWIASSQVLLAMTAQDVARMSAATCGCSSRLFPGCRFAHPGYACSSQRWVLQTPSPPRHSGWSEGPDPESRDSGFALRAPRNDRRTKKARSLDRAFDLRSHERSDMRVFIETLPRMSLRSSGLRLLLAKMGVANP